MSHGRSDLAIQPILRSVCVAAVCGLLLLTACSDPEVVVVRHVVFAGDHYSAVGRAGEARWFGVTADTIEWETWEGDEAAEVHSLIRWGEVTLGVAGDPGLGVSSILRTTDGLDWEELVGPTAESIPALAHFDDRFWAAGAGAGGDGESLWSSPDGGSWELETTDLGLDRILGLTAGDGHLLAWGDPRPGGPTALVSVDGASWADAGPAEGPIDAAEYIDGLFVASVPAAASADNAQAWHLAFSPDGVNWDVERSPFDEGDSGFQVMELGDESLLAVSDGNLWRTVDGASWEWIGRPCGGEETGGPENDLAWGTDRFVLASWGDVCTSTDGEDWEKVLDLDETRHPPG